jgi:hypothetical protein
LTLKYSERREVVNVMTRAPTRREAQLVAISAISSSGKQVEFAKTRSASVQEEAWGSARKEPWVKQTAGGALAISGQMLLRNLLTTPREVS